MFGYAGSKMYRRKLAKSCDLPKDEREDFIYNLKALAESDRFSVAHDMGYFYLQHNESEMRTFHANEDERTIVFCDAFVKGLNEVSLPKGRKKRFFDIVAYSALADCLSGIVTSDMGTAEKDKKCNGLLAYTGFRNGKKLKHADNKLYT